MYLIKMEAKEFSKILLKFYRILVNGVPLIYSFFFQLNLI